MMAFSILDLIVVLHAVHRLFQIIFFAFLSGSRNVPQNYASRGFDNIVEKQYHFCNTPQRIIFNYISFVQKSNHLFQPNSLIF